MKRFGLIISILVIASMVLAACGAAPEPEVVEVEKIVTEVVEVEKEVEKVVTQVVEVEKEVEKVVTEVVEVEVTAVPEPQEPVVILSLIHI